MPRRQNVESATDIDAGTCRNAGLRGLGNERFATIHESPQDVDINNNTASTISQSLNAVRC